MLLPRSRELLESEIRQFTVIEREGMIIACGALYPQEGNSGELACVATHPDYRKKNMGQSILEQIEKNARKAGLDSLFVLTTKTPHWFMERGFAQSDLEQFAGDEKIPVQLSAKFQNFCKIAVIKPAYLH